MLCSTSVVEVFGGGIHFVKYLDAGNYYGTDLNQSLLDAGYDIELDLAGVKARLPRTNLACIGDFDYSEFSRTFDFVLAHSLFTHLTLNQIRECLEKLLAVTRPGCKFFATFFEIPRDQPASVAVRHEPGGIVTHGSQDPYHYRVSDFEFACAGLPWSVQCLGDWNHPRDQHMLALRRY